MKRNNNSLNFKSNINNTETNSISNVICFSIILLLTFGMMYILNKNTHFTSDDFRYNFMYESFMPNDGVQRLSSFSDIIKSMYNHYFMWGGRITAHTLVQFFLMFDKQFFNIINSIAFVGLAVLVYLHSNVSKKINIPLLIGIIFSLWFFIPQFGLTVLWVSGAGNYLWCTIIILLFLLPYRKYLENEHSFKDNTLNFILMIIIGILAGWTNENTGGAMILLTMLFIAYYKFENEHSFKDNTLNFILMIIIGILAGWTNENTGGAMILLTMLFIAYYKLKNVKIPNWAFSGFVSSCIGFGLLVLAPGNNARKEYLVNKTINIIKNIGNVFGTSFTLMFGLTILLLVVLAFFLITNNNTQLISKSLTISFMYIFSALAGIIVLIVSPQIPGKSLTISFMYIFSALAGIIVLIVSPQIPARTWFGPIVFIIVAIGNIYSNISINSKSLNIILVACLIGFTIKFADSYSIAYKDIVKTYNSINTQISTINTEKESGNLDIEIKNIPKAQSEYNAFRGSRYVSDDKESWLNKWMAKYYGVNSIVGVD